MLDSVPVLKLASQTDASEATERVILPQVFSTPIRRDVVERVHDLVMKNTRQPYARKHKAGANYSAESWGVGRAKARVMRIKASGTGCSANGAYANFTRGGHMFSPLTLNRRWGRLINTKEKRLAIQSSIAASGVTPLVMARGHICEKVENLPTVVDDLAEKITKTKEAVALLKSINCYDDVLKCIASKRQRAGKGKRRNRRYKMKRGPLIVFKKDEGIRRAFRNIPGVSLMQVDSPNVLKLAPGGHVGRMCVWTKSAFESLDASLGGVSNYSAPIVKNTCLRRVLKSEQVRSTFLSSRVGKSSHSSAKKINPLKSKSAMKRLNPFYKHFTQKYAGILSDISR